jgi:hypothetical protein
MPHSTRILVRIFLPTTVPAIQGEHIPVTLVRTPTMVGSRLTTDQMGTPDPKAKL